HVLDAIIEGGLEVEALELEGTAGQLLGHVAHALKIGGNVDRRDDGAQVRRHGLAAGDHGDGHVVDLALHIVDALIGDDGNVGQFAIELEKALVPFSMATSTWPPISAMDWANWVSSSL